ncbi:alpha/beta fold hydrolase [Actinoplanes couchii]|uniref:Alpha/beta hydrolase n=1 Tax=Actinoplanes couchii TaxID=403638 RepID=A0ABQ3XKJ5_9ACTN|nr:alpha/beta fold hydrolase [Actinoplanes couchii]MDR6320614.1 pimeloyl-ACP methyl ester carboxylesterase [Actinoplanes couchii]GID59016.1 alpha/beta hydrolase [Actinoplanes couchii]
MVPALATTARVIRIDLPGHGHSPEPSDGDHSIPRQGHHLARALDRLGVQRAVVTGHSTGGYVATALAEQRPELVTALALIDTGPDRDAFVSDGPAGKLLLAPVLGPLLWRLRTDGLVRRGLSTAVAPGFPIPQRLVDDTRALTHRTLTRTSQESEDYLPLPTRLTELGKPLLVLFGDRDQRWRPASAARYQPIPDTTVELLPGVGHSPMIEAPTRTAEFLMSFLLRTR